MALPCSPAERLYPPPQSQNLHKPSIPWSPIHVDCRVISPPIPNHLKEPYTPGYSSPYIGPPDEITDYCLIYGYLQVRRPHQPYGTNP